MQTRILGTTMPVLEVLLDPNEGSSSAWPAAAASL
jgi:hypothetical protein